MSILKTKRLLLRPLNSNDAESMFQNWTYDERVARYCRWYPHKSISETKQLLKMYLEQIKDGFDYRWGIELQETNELIGCIDVVNLSDDNKTAIIGYVLSHKYWNNGISTEALSAVITKLFDDGVETIQARHHIDNIASGRVMEKCGMKFSHNDKVQCKFRSTEMCTVKCYEIRK